MLTPKSFDLKVFMMQLKILAVLVKAFYHAFLIGVK